MAEESPRMVIKGRLQNDTFVSDVETSPVWRRSECCGRDVTKRAKTRIPNVGERREVI